MDIPIGLVQTILNNFCDKQGFTGCEVGDVCQESLIFFNGQFGMTLSDVLLDMELDIKKGIAVNYMQGFDMELDDAQIPKELSYKEYLESKKLI